MELRTRHRAQLRRAAMTAALGALLVPATAGAATKKTPTISKVSPKSLKIGDTMTVTGRYFVRGKAKNTVLFRSPKGAELFVKADVSTTRKLYVVLPDSLAKYLSAKNGLQLPTKFRLRVLSSRLGRKFTTAKLSPTIAPKPAGAGGNGTPPPPPVAQTNPNGDADGDGLTNAFEVNVTHTDPLQLDSDGDGVADGFEYRSAVDLNNDDYRAPTSSLPYPGKRPYPNPLDASDADTDFDGDSLTLSEEFRLWRYTVTEEGADPSLDHLTYSDGLKYSIYTQDQYGRHPALLAANYSRENDFKSWLSISGYGSIYWRGSTTPESLLDVDRSGGVESTTGDRYSDGRYFESAETDWLDTHGPAFSSPPDGYLSDDERDEDADGLSNFTESHGPLSDAGWWSQSFYKDEKGYPIVYDGTKLDDADSDGDGIRDGADDQDHDDIPNIAEVSRNAASGVAIGTTHAGVWWGRVNPFNPCLPDTGSRTCPIVIPAPPNAWAPYDGSPNYEVNN